MEEIVDKASSTGSQQPGSGEDVPADGEQRPETPSTSNNEIEEGELPPEDVCKPATPSKPYVLFSPRDSGLEPQQQELSTPRKPVLGKEKAKQRLKALGIQKKIHMESRNQITSKRLAGKSNTELCSVSASGSHTRRDKKLLSPHEKAQLTINEIEVMKLEEERGKVPVYYNESMIHRITADSFDDSKRNIGQPSLMPSIEVLKSYEEESYRGEERKRKRTKPEAYRRRRRSGSSTLLRRKLKFKGEKSNGQLELSLDRRKKSRKTRIETIPRESRSETQIQEQEERFTRTRPVISFQFNPLVVERKLKSKMRKKAKRRQESKASRSTTEGEKIRGNEKKKRRKKRRSSGNKDANSSNSTKRGKKKSKKSAKPKRPAGVLSFAIDDVNFEEEVDDFPLSKEGFQPTSDSEDRPERIAISNDGTVSRDAENELVKTREDVENLKCSSPLNSEIEGFSTLPVPDVNESAIEEKSPDTDDYMPCWEEDDDDDSDKCGAWAFLCKSEQKGDPSNDDAYSSTEETTPESIKDGLSTPIFVNPSPPEEVENVPPRDSSCGTQFKRRRVTSGIEYQENESASEEEESLTPPIAQPKHLFEMENIYEQFLKSVREDPDFKDIAEKENRQSSNENSPSTTPDTESGFLSQTSVLTASSFNCNSSNAPSSSTSSSNPTSDSDDTSDTGSSEMLSTTETVPQDQVEATNEESSCQNEVAAEADDLSNISPDDLKKLRSVQKRHGMLKWIRQQIDGMDEEDRQCLLGLEKLIRAERQLLLRNDSIRRLHERKNILGTDSEDSKGCDELKTSKNDADTKKCDREECNSNEFSLCSLEENAALSAGVENEEIFDVNRETIKMTITNSQMKILSKKALAVGDYKTIADDDQDFTERLMKAKNGSKSCTTQSNEKSSEGSKKRKNRRGRSLSLSPMRRSKKSPTRNRQSDRTRRSAYSPSPSRSSSARRRESRLSTRSRRSGSPARSGRSRRSSRRSSGRSIASASPTNSRSSSRSISRSPVPGKEGANSPTDERVLESYSVWNIDRYSQYYIGDSYYYPRISSDNNAADKQSRYPTVYHEYAPYNLYTTEYMNAHSGYPTEYSHQAVFSDPHRGQPMDANIGDSYLRIPVIGSTAIETSDDYFYKADFEDASGMSQTNEIMPQEGSNSIKPFAVQKGNVLEIVPATTISGVVKEVVAIKKEPTSFDENQETSDNDESDVLRKLLGDERWFADNLTDTKVPGKSSKRGYSWKSEVARRHVVSAVIRLNKETEDSPRGILKSRGNAMEILQEKKKVLFADGIPPGRTSSSSSDEEATLKLIRKRLKKTERRMRSENKENELLNEAGEVKNALTETKPDPELWDAPPPPPPAGSPPPHLLQPALIRPSSPEELLYFHYDPVYNMMYVSPMENAIPPRLLQSDAKSVVKPDEDASPTENGETIQDTSAINVNGSNSPPVNSQEHFTEETNCISEGDNDITDQKPAMVPSPEHQKSDETPPPLPVIQECKSDSPAPAPPQSSSPPQQIQNIVSIRLSNSPLLYHHEQSGVAAPPSYECPQSSQPHLTRPPIPIMVGYPGQIFNRMQNRRVAGNLARDPYNVLPPPAHSRAFNPHIPPPFHQSPVLNGPPPNYDGPGPAGIPSMAPTNGPRPSPPFNPNMMMYNSPQQQMQLSLSRPPRPPSFGYGMGPHIVQNRPISRFSSIPPPVPMPNFQHADRKGSPLMGSHVFHHQPPLPFQPPSPSQPSTPPPVNP